MEQIDRDVMRTHPDLHFFSGDDQTATTHREACTRHHIPGQQIPYLTINGQFPILSSKTAPFTQANGYISHGGRSHAHQPAHHILCHGSALSNPSPLDPRPRVLRAAAQEMKRALFIFAKLNPGLRYVQGMNELLAPLYFHFRTDPDPRDASCAEADAFFCFMDIISEFRDHFCQQLVRA